MIDLHSLAFTIPRLRAAYQSGVTPEQVMREARRRIDGDGDNPVWIHCLDDAELAPYLNGLYERSTEDLPLYGIPFAIKDNIDLAGVPTTAACAAFRHVPDESAFVVEKLIAAGAIPVGKTNMDQFATGLVGTRSPWGAVRNAFDPGLISGGSSSGSAVAVALGQAAFALGTDTAGSGRVPAAFNNLVGYKPSRGLISTRGVVPACRSLDCVSIFALTAEDAARVAEHSCVHDDEDPYARPYVPAEPRLDELRVGVPRAKDLEFFGNVEYERLFDTFVNAIASAGHDVREIDISPLLDAAELLYEGAWVAERYHATRRLVDTAADALRDEFRAIVEPARDLAAVDYFDGAYRLADYRRQAERLLRTVDVITMPTAGTHFSIAEIEASPHKRNAELGYYTNFMNLLDLCGVAMPAGFTGQGLPFGVTLVADAMSDRALLRHARHLLSLNPRRLGALDTVMSETPPARETHASIALAVCGAHLSGMPLNGQLVERNAHLREATRTAPIYRLYALPGGPPCRPGLVRAPEGGVPIEVEVYEMPAAHIGGFLAGIPEPLGLGRVELECGEWVTGFICEPWGLVGAEDISSFGGWRRYIARREE